jgi:hypothetical protein
MCERLLGTRFRGGRVRRRDRWFGLERRADFGHFKRWWHRHGKRRHGSDIRDRDEAVQIYEDWLKQGKPQV